MGTRADFYVRKGGEMEWLGSIPWDGYPDGIAEEILRAQSEKDYKIAVKNEIHTSTENTSPE